LNHTANTLYSLEVLLQFQIGDMVVHPVYGVGTIKTFSKQLFAGEQSHEYYQVIAGKSTLWVPINDQGSTVLRKIAAKGSLNECRKLLKRNPVPLNRDRKIRELEIARLLKDRLLPALCETVRDLQAHSRQTPLGRIEGDLLKKTFKALCDEWAAAEGVTTLAALGEIESLIQEGHQKLLPETGV
jgi:RNA polymerase-interacting CarD/CdnL/TRCF family regulator